MGRQVEQILLLFARLRQLLEIVGIDDHMAGRAGHHPFARALERLACRPGDVEQALPRRRFHFLVESSVRTEETHQGHALTFSCAWAWAAIRLHASTSSDCLV